MLPVHCHLLSVPSPECRQRRRAGWGAVNGLTERIGTDYTSPRPPNPLPSVPEIR